MFDDNDLILQLFSKIISSDIIEMYEIHCKSKVFGKTSLYQWEI